MKALKIFAFALVVVIAGCININVRVTFPEAEFQRAADRIVDDVQKSLQQPGGPSSALPAQRHAASWSLISYAYAANDKEININIETPEIEEIKARMEKNFQEYKQYKDNGSIGENLSGYLEERTEGSSELSSSDRKDLRKLVQRENRDRKDLYLALLKANDRDASELPEIERIFANSWYGKSLDTWYVRYKDPEQGLVWLTRAEWDEKQGE
jgi:hypothetical protein